jgi:putative hemolysin
MSSVQTNDDQIAYWNEKAGPKWVPEFNCADLFILMPVSRMNARYAKHFLRKAA